jgi:hypothetical protein
MAISRYENVDVNNLTFTTSDLGENVTTITKWFTGRPLVQDVKNSLQISNDTRIYQDLTRFVFNYTPWMQQVVLKQDKYSITYRGSDWRITDCIEANDKMSVTLLCYRNDPVTKV